MTELIDIRDFVQQICEATAAVVDIDITVMDQHMLRIAGTGQYRSEVGQKITATAGFSGVLENGQPVFIFNPVTDKACQSCLQKETCHEVANIAYPIIVSNCVKGVMALLAFNEEQKLKLIRGKTKFSRFLEKMTEIISSKLQENETQGQLARASQRLESIIGYLPDGVIFSDAQGLIICCNQAARKLTGFTSKGLLGKRMEEIYPLHPFLQTLLGGHPVTDREVVWELDGRIIRCLCSTKPLYHEDLLIGVIAILKDYETLRTIVNEMGGYNNYFSLDQIMGSHQSLVNAKEKAKKAAGSKATVLIQGESGTGKELFARGIHGHSRRLNAPFIAINCAAIPETLLESELFGYEGGAFTGAKSKGKPGKFELAKGGTVFLDEIGDVPLNLQAKLLRVLEEGKVSRLGGIQPISLDVRIIAATNQNLEELIIRREFREDLFYRLNVIPLKLPSLRELPCDISLLARYFLETFANVNEVLQFTPQVLEAFERYTWPGNVRELRNAVEYAVNMADGVLIELENIPERVRQRPMNFYSNLPFSGDGLASLEEMEKILLERGLTVYGHSDKAKGRIADRLGMSKASVYRKLRKYNLAL